MTVAGLLFLLLLDERVSWRRCAVAFVVGLTAPLLLGVEQVVMGTSAAQTWLGLAARDAQRLGDAVVMVGGERVLRAYGSFPHPNLFGGYLAVALLLTRFLYGHLHRLMPSFVTLFFLVGLGMTFSRSAFLGLVIGLLWFVWFDRLQHVRSERIRQLTRSLLMLGGVCLFILPFMVQRFHFAEITEQRSVVQRIDQYQEWWGVFNASPFIGHGLGNYTIALAKQQPGQSWWEYQPVHSASLVALAEVGVVGVLVFIVLILTLLTRREEVAVRALALLAVLVPIDLLDHYLWTSWSGLALCALVLAAVMRDGEQRSSSHEGLGEPKGD